MHPKAKVHRRQLCLPAAVLVRQKHATLIITNLLVVETVTVWLEIIGGKLLTFHRSDLLQICRKPKVNFSQTHFLLLK